MSSITIVLFGPPHVQVNGQTVYLRKRKAEALLAYLAVTRAVHSRDALATLLWPEFDQRRARMYLRQQLYHLRRKLGAEQFIVTQETLGLAQTSGITTDVEQFHAHLAAAHQHEMTDAVANALSELTQADALYHDDFLAGFSVGDAPGFEEWQRYERESLRRALIDALQALTEGYGGGGQVDQALDYARRWVSLAPLQEAAHRSLMRLYAQAGDQAAALAQYDCCAALLADELDAPPAPTTTALYARIKSGKPLTSQEKRPQSKTQPSPHHHLPCQPTPFLGRSVELAQIASDLADPGCRLLTILGPGGIGKSRLAIAAAHAAAKHFAQGVHLVPLAALHNVQQLDTAILQALEIPQQSTATSQALLLETCRNKEMLLVLDNYEHLLPTTDLITTLLAGAPRIKLLVTTRERLNLAAEWVLPLTGLAVPPLAVSDEPAAYTAVQLFAQAAQRVQPAFVLTTANGAAVVQLCRLVDGNPLALELAAGWLKMMPPALIVHEVQRNLGILRTETQDVSPRHRSMATVFEQSWRLLSNGERNTLRQLAVFVGTFDYAAAQAVTAATLPQLATLIDKSWIAATATGRLYLHELVRQFAKEKLVSEHQLATGETEAAVHRRHSQWYGKLLHRMEPLLQGQDQVRALQQIRTERTNIWAAWQWAVAQHAVPFFQAAVFPLWYAADTLGWFPEAIDAYTTAINVLRAKMLSVQKAGEAPRMEMSLILAKLLTYQAILYPRCGQLAQAQQNCTEALAHLQTLSTTPQQQFGTALAQLVHGWVLHDLAADEAAVTALTQAHAILDGPQHRWWLGQAELLLGLATHSLGQHDTAKQHFVAAAQLWQTLGEQRFRCFALGRLAELAREAGDLTAAQSYLTEVYQLRHLLGDRVGLSYALAFLGDTALAQGDQSGAACWYAEAQQLAQELGNHHVLLDTHQGLGEVALAQGAWAEADRAFHAAYRLALEAQRPQQMVTALLGRSDVAVAQGEVQQAHTFLREALQLTTETRSDPLQLQVLFHVAEVAQRHGESTEAARLLTLICRHPAAASLLQEQATQLLERMAESGVALPAPAAAATPKHLNAVVTSLLAQGFLD